MSAPLTRDDRRQITGMLLGVEPQHADAELAARDLAEQTSRAAFHKLDSVTAAPLAACFRAVAAGYPDLSYETLLRAAWACFVLEREGKVPTGERILRVDRPRQGGHMIGDGKWTTTTRANSSPVERERDRLIERAILRDGRPLDKIGIVAEQTGSRWSVEVLGRDELLERLDTRGRLQSTGALGAEILKACAAWIRGLPAGVCPELFRWDNGDGTWSYQRGTIERDASRPGRPTRAPAPRRARP